MSEMSPSADAAPRPEQLGLALYGAKGWMKFLGVLSILYGVFTAMSLIGLLIAWLPVWMGILLYQAANALEYAVQGDDAEALTRTLAKLRTYFVITGVLALIGLVIMVAVMSLGVGMGMFQAGGMAPPGGRVM